MTNAKKDPGFYPSDWKPPTNIQDIQKIFESHKFFGGRMIGSSKTHYRQEHPDDLIVFNANIIMPEYGKVWYGDLNLTEDHSTLREIAECLDTTLYVLWEMDARFGSENKAFKELETEAVWNTASVPFPTAKWYANKWSKLNKGERK